MKILVINGSPKGKYSTTLQTLLFIQKVFPEQDFQFLHVGQKIKHYEKDFTEVKEALEHAELILFSYPIYTFIAPYQTHRCIELIKENSIDLHNKFASQITTSKHFYDVTAHQYIQENCSDLGLKYVRGLSADSDDLLTKKGQQDAEKRCEVGGNFLAGIATDEDNTTTEIKRLSNNLVYALEHHLTRPKNFYGVGGMKIFRDLIYLMRGIMKADHKFYKKHKIYDFSHRQKGTIIKMKILGALMSLPKAQKKVKGNMNAFVIAPYKKVVETAVPHYKK